MSSRAKKKQAARGEASVKEHIEFLRASTPDAYFKTKAKIMENLCRNGITPDDLKAEFQRGREVGSREAYDSVGMIYTCAMLEALNSMYGFGRKRLVAIMDHMNEFMTRTLTSRDAMQEVYDKIGVNFFKDDPFHPLQFKD